MGIRWRFLQQVFQIKPPRIGPLYKNGGGEG